MATEKILWKCDECKKTVEITFEDLHITFKCEIDSTKVMTLCTDCYEKIKGKY